MGLRDEIFEQPEALTRLFREQSGPVSEIGATLKSRSIRFVYIAARGTSDHAGLYAKYLFGIHNQMPVALAAPSIFSLYEGAPHLKDALVIGISQSGQSPDIVGVLKAGASQGASTLAITNTPDSPLAEAAEFVIPTCAGTESAVAATKSYTTQLAAVAMLSVALGSKDGDEGRLAELEALPSKIEEVLEIAPQVERDAERYRFMERCVILGRGFQLATAAEWALKLKELTYVVAESYPPSDFRHGPIAIVDPGFPILAVLTRGRVWGDGLELLRQLKEERRADLLVISDDPEALALGRTAFALPPDIPEWLSPIVAIVPGQLFSLYLTLHKELDPEVPRGLKKVTRTL